MNARQIIEALIAKGHKPASLARQLDLSAEAFYAVRFSKAEPCRELERRLRQLAGMEAKERHAEGCPPRYGR
jgi:hypothetical protein